MMRFLKYLLWEFHPSRVCLFHRNWQSFAFTPWLTYSWKYQWIYLVYRWIVAMFFFGWIFTIGLESPGEEVKFFIYLTNWTYLLWTANLIWNAASCTAVFFYYFCCCSKRFADKFDEAASGRHSFDLLLADKPSGCCCCHRSNDEEKRDETFWHQKIQWVLHNVAIVMAFAIALLYWALLYDPEAAEELNVDVHGPVNIITHAVNGFIGLVDVFVSGIPFHLLHVIYPAAFASSYLVFTGVYHAFNGTDAFDRPFVYSLINYGDHPGVASGVGLSVVLLYIPLVYGFIYSLYLIREGFIYLLRKVCGKNFERKNPGAFEML